MSIKLGRISVVLFVFSFFLINPLFAEQMEFENSNYIAEWWSKVFCTNFKSFFNFISIQILKRLGIEVSACKCNTIISVELNICKILLMNSKWISYWPNKGVNVYLLPHFRSQLREFFLSMISPGILFGEGPTRPQSSAEDLP